MLLRLQVSFLKGIVLAKSDMKSGSRCQSCDFSKARYNLRIINLVLTFYYFLVLQVRLFVYLVIYCIYFLQLKEMVDNLTRKITMLQFRFEHDQASNVPSRCLFREIQNLRKEQSAIQEAIMDLLNYLSDY